MTRPPPTAPFKRPAAFALALVWSGTVTAQAISAAQGDAGWQRCANTAQADERLRCYDEWAAARAPGPRAAAPLVASAALAASPALPKPSSSAAAAAVASATAASQPVPDPTPCHNPRLGVMARAWELEREADCGVFTIRGYRPISLSLITADSVNAQPQSENPLNSATSPLAYRRAETRVQVSVRTKIAQGLLTGDGPARDSLWFAYTQQSYWQLFTGALSRPFRSTDHEPEFIYVIPIGTELPAGWTWRFAGLGVVHQSNGQSLPLSRSWNRGYLMAGAEHPRGLGLQVRYWKRLNEAPATDDNPSISDYIGRAELAATWQATPRHQLGVTLRHSMRSEGRGSVRLEWMGALGRPNDIGLLGGLRLHAQVFSGYGDSLLDYNRRRTVLSVGVSLVDW